VYTLNNLRRGAPYIPVADTAWVKEVIELTLKEIPKEKLILGIPTYGYEYAVTVSPNWFQSYTKLWSLNNEYAVDSADDFDITPSRTASGEMSFSYLPKDSVIKESKLNKMKVPSGTLPGNKVAAQALAYANQTGETVSVNYVVWNDAGTIEERINLAKQYGLGGVAIFKIDGGEDQDMYDVLEN
jgi:spore germination protein YaaH